MKGLLDKFQKISSNNDRGAGKTLGGTKSGTLKSISISEQGPIGVQLENTSAGSAIIGKVIPGGVAEAAGLLRGDIICYPNTNGNDEIKYKGFLEMIKSNTRPLQFEVRRVETPSLSSNTDGLRADAYARKQAMIAAAEARDKQNKFAKKPVRSGKELTSEQKQKIAQQREQNALRNAEQMCNAPMSETSQKAVEAAKQDETKRIQELGYNPYESSRSTGKQGAAAAVATTHGSIKYQNEETSSNSKEKLKKQSSISKNEGIDPDFDRAYSSLVMTNKQDEGLAKSIRIIHKLIVNATKEGNSDDQKRKVRISNANKLIQEAINDMNGALDVMMSVGFVITENEEDSETYLVYPPGDSGPEWLQKALSRLEEYERQL
jgi:hypothetical protein